MNIFFFEIEPKEQQAYQQAFAKDTCFFFDYPLTEKTIPKKTDAEIISVFIYSSITSKVIQQFPNLKLIVSRSTGLEHIDLKASEQRNITVTNLPTYADVTVAEFTFALILMLARKLKQAIERTEQLNFSTESLRGFDLQSKTIGIIGMGNIGKQVARIARGFNMNIIAFDVHQDPTCAQEFDFCYVELKKLLAESDIITVHVPLNKHTYHLINKENIHNIKKGALLINTARGGIIETEALIYGLQKNILGGIGLDVLEHECETEHSAQTDRNKTVSEHALKTVLCNCLLARQPNVIITPHIAFNSSDAYQRRTQETIASINDYKKQVN